MYPKTHKSHRVGWLRAAVLGANDGIVSTASLILGVAAAGSSQQAILVAGVAALVAGAMSMAAGEYVSVSSQADTETADLKLEAMELAEQPAQERTELAAIYTKRGIEPVLAMEVARQLMAHDALAAHARDELGISSTVSARPIQAAFSSALAFTLGAAWPLLLVMMFSSQLMLAMAAGSLVGLALLGALAAKAGGAPMLRAAMRVSCWGAGAMALTALIGSLFGVVT
ncbi:membrane protein [Arsukibacterium sp. MJ3]|uniref:VIT1/CCC1 transporter family protein n=1 Tax=Arsukibacterium sp. MJ3 TaxID=1632859 RepID=UPI0006274224|nr:VIT family protein [Arsukibacterium sp. MJ3]KKO49603.1 membrane protein [Arsukibacterium sp. MJ3]